MSGASQSIATRSKSKNCDEDETNYTEVLKILKRVERNLQELKTSQTNMETKLEVLAVKLNNQQSDIKDLKESANFFSSEMASLKDSNTATLCALSDQKEALNKHQIQLITLQNITNDAERYSRSFNFFLVYPKKQHPVAKTALERLRVYWRSTLTSELILRTPIDLDATILQGRDQEKW